MLVNLHVKNLTLIEEIDVNFKEGFNVLTGETGAGKSIIIGSINIALGGKVSHDIVRKGAEYALVELEFMINDKEKINKLKELGVVEIEGGQLFINRKITQGRSVSKVNGESVTNTQLKKVTSLLIDIHGQHEHQSLLNESKHLEILDRYAKDEIETIKVDLKEMYDKYIDLKSKLDELENSQKNTAKEIAFLKYEINEIEEAKLIADEDIELEETYKRLNNSQKIIGSASNALKYSQSALNDIGEAIKDIQSILSYDDKLDNILKQFIDAESIINDANSDLANYLSYMEYEPEYFNQVIQRMDLINSLKSKYGNSIMAIEEYKEKAIENLNILENADNYRQDLIIAINAHEKVVDELSQKLSNIRKNIAKQLTEKIKEALHDLNFLSVNFDMDFIRNDHYTANGYDIARFVISVNPGEDLKPISSIASGGEMSRIMLAIKSVIANKDETDTLIFDEIDTGISGRTAQMVSEKIKLISNKHQVMCITHLPQIAAMADEHFLIEKNVSEDRTVTNIVKLDEDAIVNELARLIGGAKITNATLDSAREMKQLATATKV